MADKSIRAQSEAVAAMSADWPMIDALMDGTTAMRAAGETFLPKWPNEADDSYKCRLGQAVLHPVFKRTVLVNAARPFSKAPTFGEQTPAKTIEWSSNIDMEGNSFVAFSVKLMIACIAKGIIGVLVDVPRSEGARSVAEEQKAGIRPYCVQYPANSILGWKTEKTADGIVLSQLRLLEYVEESDGDYRTATIEQVRVLAPGGWEVYRENAKIKDQWDLKESGKTSLDFIPFIFFYGVRTGFGTGASPLSDLAFQNVEHWQSASDQQTILHVARVPILFAKMFDEGTLTIGAGAAAQSTNEKADLKFVEHTGAAIGAGQQSLDALEDRMRATGAELISLDPGYATATEVSADGEATRSLLQQITENFEASAQKMLDYMGAWMKEPGGAEVEFYKDFGISTDSDPQAVHSAVGAGSVSRQTHFEELQRRNVISSDRTWDDEKLRLNGEAQIDLANQALAAQIKSGTNTRNPGPQAE